MLGFALVAAGTSDTWLTLTLSSLNVALDAFNRASNIAIALLAALPTLLISRSNRTAPVIWFALVTVEALRVVQTLHALASERVTVAIEIGNNVAIAVTFLAISRWASAPKRITKVIILAFFATHTLSAFRTISANDGKAIDRSYWVAGALNRDDGAGRAIWTGALLTVVFRALLGIAKVSISADLTVIAIRIVLTEAHPSFRVAWVTGRVVLVALALDTVAIQLHHVVITVVASVPRTAALQ